MMKASKSENLPAGATLVTLASLVYASYGVWTMLMGSYFGNFTQAVFRASLVGSLLLLIAMLRKQLTPVHWNRDRKWLAALLLANLLIPAPMYYAVLHVGVGLSMGIGYASAVVGAFFFGWLFNHERYTKDKWVSTILGILGLWLIFFRTASGPTLLPMVAAAASGFGTALDIIALKKLGYSSLQSAGMSWIAVVLVNLPFMFLLREQIPAIHFDSHWFWLIVFAAASVTASWLHTSGLKLIEAGTVGVLGLLEVAFAVILGAVLFKEQLTAPELLGLISIMTAATVPYAMHFRAAKRSFVGFEN